MDEATTLERRIFEALRYMPLLECLTLLMIRPDTPLDTQVAFLPNLRILKLSGLSCISIFNHVSFPPTTSVEIACYDWGESIVEQDWNAFWTSIARIMSPSFYPGESRTLKTVAVDGDDDGIATLRAWNSADMPCDFTFHTAPAPTPGISVVIEWQGAPEEAWEHGQEVSRIFSELLEAAFRALPMPALETLHLGAFPGRDYLHSDFLVDILEPHLLWSRNFRTLITRTEHCAEFILAASFHQPDGRSGLPFPALETLVLLEASCFVNNMDVALLGCLNRRAEKGIKLKKLVLWDGHSI
ncbi:hypothetical protein MPER_06544 [Moniliophthora perniciosa FA553]|nr:hypothetical protein MPER_06544 [Moniliophthora perniciosa FA553]